MCTTPFHYDRANFPFVHFRNPLRLSLAMRVGLHPTTGKRHYTARFPAIPKDLSTGVPGPTMPPSGACTVLCRNAAGRETGGGQKIFFRRKTLETDVFAPECAVQQRSGPESGRTSGGLPDTFSTAIFFGTCRRAARSPKT